MKKRFPDWLEEYLSACRGSEADGKKKGGSFPNLAGFCRFLGCGIPSFEDFAEREPALAAWALAVFEDEALNAPSSPTLATAYLKQRLGYGEKEKAPTTPAECGEVKLVFDHDILEDGS